MSDELEILKEVAEKIKAAKTQEEFGAVCVLVILLNERVGRLEDKVRALEAKKEEQ